MSMCCSICQSTLHTTGDHRGALREGFDCEGDTPGARLLRMKYCSHNRTVNTPEFIYCHDCGAHIPYLKAALYSSPADVKQNQEKIDEINKVHE